MINILSLDIFWKCNKFYLCLMQKMRPFKNLRPISIRGAIDEISIIFYPASFI